MFYNIVTVLKQNLLSIEKSPIYLLLKIQWNYKYNELSERFADAYIILDAM